MRPSTPTEPGSEGNAPSSQNIDEPGGSAARPGSASQGRGQAVGQAMGRSLKSVQSFLRGKQFPGTIRITRQTGELKTP
eukprot:CAMPEP_0198222140 /NCGR_PEP_ID=MMETSP1445-20131203/86752_1 /TAXON_ID=36898 /ORGANISM="Pyramimonas sp., Strain CCMP2087" /LENGTH=78 /DNA_ID=CAMNT_0043900539 /DNA_START=35 /DNA_END=267 /DNA_ORIENTATION=-